MLESRYDEMLLDDASTARENERLAIDRSIWMLQMAAKDGASAVTIAEALHFTTKLWAVLVEDLISPHNSLPKQLRAQIVSIGIWILREVERIRMSEEKSFADVLQVSKAIRDGLL